MKLIHLATIAALAVTVSGDVIPHAEYEHFRVREEDGHWGYNVAQRE
jgi:hypothetical protein